MKFVLFLALILQTEMLLARSFEAVVIPGARCGNGDDYVVYISKLSDEKILLEFMGGGACWDKTSCFERPYTWIRPVSHRESYSVLTSSDEQNPFRRHSMVYFPYCTGDVHMGNHIAEYEGKTVYHYGRRNIQLALAYLKSEKLIELKNYKDVTVWGASAGAMASLLYAKKIEPMLSRTARKTLLADSPGLHFGDQFWTKFSGDMKTDFKRSFADVGLKIDFKSGMIASRMQPVLRGYSDWNVGILIATKDSVMSTVFGNISPEEAEKRILSPEGLPAVARSFPNVKLWLKQTYMHTFLLLKKSAFMKSMQNETALEFAHSVYRR